MGLFREQALAAYANPDARGGLLRAAPPSGLALVLVIVGALGCGVAVAAATPVSTNIEGRGVVALEHGALVLRAASDGTVTAVNVTQPLVGYLLVSAAERRRLSVGQTVRLRVGSELAGTATIADLAAPPLAARRQAELFGAALASPHDLEILVRVTLPQARALTNGATFVGEIPLGTRSALSVLVPALSDDAGSGA